MVLHRSSVSRVLDTYELLEHILLLLPFHDLFVQQRVSKLWRDVIRRSNALQEEMYLVARGSPLRPISTVYNDWSGRTRAIYDPAPVLTNPAAGIIGLTEQPVPPTKRALFSFRMSDQNMFLQFDIKGIPVYETKILDPKASWRSMLVTQPPVIAINFEFIRRGGHGGSVTVYNPDGVTFGELHEWSLRLAREYWETTGEDAELSFESLTFCLMHPWTEDEMEEAW